MSHQVSVVVCAKNIKELLEQNLPQMRKSLPSAELIVIDGNSIDGTREVGEKFADKVISDEGKGLAYARHLGIVNARYPYVFFSGPDNLLSESLIEVMCEALDADPRLAGVAPQTKVVNTSTYWERTTGAFFTHFINRPGPVSVIGTPCVFKRSIILAIPYDTSITAAGDDTDLALRLLEAGYKLAIVGAYSEETMDIDLRTFIARWIWYGKGDAEFYAKHKNRWTLRRRLRSLLHPLYTYGIRGTMVLLLHGAPQYIPGMYVAVWARYRGWWKRSRELRRYA